MALNKSSNSISQAFFLVLIILASQVMLSHGIPLEMHRRYLLSHAADATKGVMEGTITPTEGEGFAGANDDVRPTNPGHSPGIGHAFTNNKIGRKLLLAADDV
uniref:Dirigent protein n=1 Tax=Oryza nivara TaxID=4536 RepID=A0A0E0GNN6_ORYNI